MPIYTFDITLAMSARVRADSEESAREVALKEANNIDASLSSDGVAFSSGDLEGDMWLVDEEELGVVHRSCGHSLCGQYYIDTGDARCQANEGAACL